MILAVEILEVEILEVEEADDLSSLRPSRSSSSGYHRTVPGMAGGIAEDPPPRLSWPVYPRIFQEYGWELGANFQEYD